MDPATVGGIGGGVLGVLGGLIGTYCSVVNTETAAERRFMIRCSAVAWLLILLFVIVPIVLVAMKILPAWIAWALWAVSMTFGLRSIPSLNRRAAELRGPAGPR